MGLGYMTKTMRVVAYSSVAIGAVVAVGLLSHTLGLLPPGSLSARSTVPLIQETTRDVQSPTSAKTKSLLAASADPESGAEPKSLGEDKALPIAARAPGRLRVSNRTTFPLRMAVLSQRVRGNPAKQSGNSRTNATSFKEPTHWDFDPEEGSGKGLILALPEGDIKLTPGDILVAFAQDGSRHYWGPYVVGETAMPAWNREGKEWQLVLKP